MAVSIATVTTSSSSLAVTSRKVSDFRVFFFNATATTEIYTLSLHDALPISTLGKDFPEVVGGTTVETGDFLIHLVAHRSEEHTSELQSHVNLVCRLLLEKKKRNRRLAFPAPASPRRAPHLVPPAASCPPHVH